MRAFPLLLAAALILPTATASASTLPPSDPDAATWVANDDVNALAREGNTLYLGGDFTRLDPPLGSALAFNPSTGALATRPGVAGEVRAVEPAPGGGAYVGGRVVASGGVANRAIAKVKADGTADPAFHSPFVEQDDVVVRAIVADGATHTIWVGGRFSTVGGAGGHSNLVALDADTGAIKTTFLARTNSDVDALVLHDGTLYVGGVYSCIGLVNDDVDCTDPGENARSALAAVEGDSGALVGTFNPRVDGQVFALTYVDDTSTDMLYAGGQNIRCLNIAAAGTPDCVDPGELPARDVVHMIAATGVGVPTAGVNSNDPFGQGGVFALETVGTHVLVGGLFECSGPGVNGDADCTDPNEVVRTNLMALDAESFLTQMLPWQPATDGEVLGITADASSAWVTGGFAHAGGKTRSFAAQIGLSDGIATAADPNLNAYGEAATTDVDGRVWFGGFFSGAGGVSRNHLAAIDLTTGQPTSFTADADDDVYDIALSDNTLYAVGRFAQLGGATRHGAGAVTVPTGVVTGFAPEPTGGLTLRVAAGEGAVALGGGFTTAGGVSTPNLAVVDPATGTARAAPAVNGTVDALLITQGALYVGGEFSMFGGQPRSRSAAVDLATNAVTGFAPGAHPSDLAFGAGRIYAAGEFDAIGGATRKGLAALDPATGAAITSFDAQLDGYAYNVATDGERVLTVGFFEHVRGGPRPFEAMVSAVDGSDTGWAPRFAAEQADDSILLDPGIAILGGGFPNQDVAPHARLATFSALPENLTPPAIAGTPNPNSLVNCTPGTWRGPYTTTGFSWTAAGVTTTPGGNPYLVPFFLGGQQLSCNELATNQRGTATATSAAVKVPNPLDVPKPPQFSLNKTKLTVAYPADATIFGLSSVPPQFFRDGKKLGQIGIDLQNRFRLVISKPNRSQVITVEAPGVGSGKVSISVGAGITSSTAKTQKRRLVVVKGKLALPVAFLKRSGGSLKLQVKRGAKYRTVKSVGFKKSFRFSVARRRTGRTMAFRLVAVPKDKKRFVQSTRSLSVRVR